MQEAGTSALAAWESFYVIVGSSSAALTGLMFVVISLVAERLNSQTAHGVAAFATPTVVHFCGVFLVSAVLSAPWRSITSPAAITGVIGLVGIVYVFIVIRRARRQSAYRPVFEDWLWHGFLPLVAYLTFAVSGLVLLGRPTPAEFAIAAATVVLLFCGIHNSWDAVTYNLLSRAESPEPGKPGSSG